MYTLVEHDHDNSNKKHNFRNYEGFKHSRANKYNVKIITNFHVF